MSMPGGERAVWYAGELVSYLLPQAATHPLFAHVAHPPEGYRFARAEEFVHVDPRLVASLVATFDPSAPIVSVGNPVFDEIAAELAWVAERAMQYGATLAAVRLYFLSFDFISQCRVPLGAPLSFIPSVPSTLGVTPWILEVEDCLTPFHPHIQNGATYEGHLSSLWCFPIIKAMLESPRCRAIVTHVRSTAETLGRLFDSDIIARKTVYAAIGLDAPPLAPRPARDPDEVVFLFTNSWQQGGANFLLRGGLEILEAFDAVSKLHPKARLLLRTELPVLAPWHREIIERNPRIELFDQAMSNEEMDALMRRADAFLLPSARLHVVSVVKAMAYGLPVIASDGWGLEEYVAHGHSGLVVKGRWGVCSWMDEETGMLREDYRPFMGAVHGDPQVTEGLAEAMHQLVEDGDLRRHLSAGAREEAVSRFSTERLNRDLKAIFDAAYAEHPAKPRPATFDSILANGWQAFDRGAWSLALRLLESHLMPLAAEPEAASRCLELAIALGLESTPETLAFASRFDLPVEDASPSREATLRRWATSVARPGMRIALLGSDLAPWVRALAPLVQRMDGQLLCVDDLRESTVVSVARSGSGRGGELAALRETLFHAGYPCVSIVSGSPEVLDMVLPEGSLDLLFIDGSHTYTMAREYILDGFHRVRQGGLIGGTRMEQPLHELPYAHTVQLDKYNPAEDHFTRVGAKVSYGVIRAVGELLPAARCENSLWCAPQDAPMSVIMADALAEFRATPRQAWRDDRFQPKLSIAQRHQAGLDAQAAGNHALARYWWNQLLVIQPTHVPTHVALIELWEAQGDDARAGEALDAALAANPQSVDLMKLAAVRCFRHRRFDLAEQFFQHVLQLAPTDLDALISLGFLKLETGQAAGAWQHFEALVTAYGQEPDAWMGLVQAARLLRDPALEGGAIARALAALPHHADIQALANDKGAVVV